jgi:hypothetical protein
MNTTFELLGKRINLAPRSHRRMFVVVIYAGFAVWIMGILSGARYFGLFSGILCVVCLLALAAVAGTGYEGGDEREVHRRDHVFFVAHRQLSWVLVVLLFTSWFRGPNPISAAVSPPVRALLEQLPFAVLFALVALYATLPQAILLWTEPDMEDMEAEQVAPRTSSRPG